VAYAVLFLLSSITAWVMLDPTVARDLQKMSKYTGHVDCKDGDKKCEDDWGQLGVYRVFFAVAVFHALLALIMIGVKSSRDVRASLQNGMWAIKLLVLVGLMVGAFFIHNSFYIAWGWIGLVGAFFFMIVQLILLVDFAHSWNESWVAKLEDGHSCYKWGLLISSFGLYALALAITVCCFVFYTSAEHETCGLSKFFVAFNLILCILVTALSVHPRVQEAMPSSGILQSGVVSFYTTYLTWSAVANISGPCSEGMSSSTTATVVGALLTFVAVAYSSVRTSSTSQLGQLGMSKSEEADVLLPSSSSDDNDDDEGANDNEKDGVSYSWMFFHITFTFAAFYLMEVLTDWSVIKDGHQASVRVGTGMSSVWIKMVSSWIAFLLYAWTLVAPILLPNRDWS